MFRHKWYPLPSFKSELFYSSLTPAHKRGESRQNEDVYMDDSTTKALLPRLLYSRHEAVDILGIGLTTLDTLLRGGDLTRIKIGRRSLVTDESIRRYIADQTTEGLS